MTTTMLYAVVLGAAAGGGLWLIAHGALPREQPLKDPDSVGDTGHAEATGAEIAVFVTHRQPTQILSLAGIDQLVTTAHATARAEQGITTPWLQGKTP
ncbi:hypothetical protein [Streptantibioticus ferralitis]|uniref:Uncharacterized protein n=1 Tax=Streptantibioticus ferralitis TaxID=236510 RepID=A0ABT5ZBA9_9ACTN|nr:hypothetical protein [Streptantibioticus ferralitis]MDF2261125.1 hypothetical protein [Streptantibioticus ferralitis]